MSVAMAQDGLANLKEGVEEAFADLGIPFQLKQVKDNLVLNVLESGEGYFIGQFRVQILTNRWGRATTSVLSLRMLW